MDHQDWTTIVLRKNNTQKQIHRPVNHKTFKNIDSSDPEPPKTIGLSASKQIQQVRVAKKLTQKELAQKINVKPQLITDYEAGKAIPSRAVINKINRVLGIVVKIN